MKGTTTMIDIDTTSVAPTFAEQKSHRGLLIGVIVASVITLAVLAGYSFHQHSALGKSQTHAADVSSQLASAKKDLSAAKNANADLTTQNQTLTDTAEQCSVFVPVSKHMFKAMQYELKAVTTGGSFGSIIWLPKATSEMHKVTDLYDSHQSYDGELEDVCGPSASTNS